MTARIHSQSGIAKRGASPTLPLPVIARSEATKQPEVWDNLDP
jgi:hypothetical protein